MDLKKNIQGQFDNRFEDGNKGGILKVSPKTSVYPIDAESEITYTEVIKEKNVIIGIDNEYLNYPGDSNNLKYNNLIQPYDFVRVYTNINKEDWVDLKVIKVELDNFGSYETLITGIVVRGNFSSIQIGDTAKWSFYHQVPISDGAPKNIEVVNIINDTAQVRWEDSTIDNSSLFYQLGFRKWGDVNWSYTTIGGWIESLSVNLESSRWPIPTETYNSELALWMEFSNPEAADGKKAEGWVSINKNGNFKNFYVTERGSGYLREPNIKLYYKVLDDHRIKNFVYSRPNSNPNIHIEAPNHTFDAGDLIIVDSGILKGSHEILNVGPNHIEISPDNINVFQINGVNYYSSMNLELAPIPEPKVPGRIIPNLFRDKYNISGLDNNSIYEVFVLSYFNKELSKFSDMSIPVKFITR